MWNDVRTKKEIHIGLLREEEAWQLFREKAGDSADDPELQPIAKQIVNECGRLPLALVTIGSVLNNSIKHIWEDLLLRLQMPHSSSSLSGVPAEVYKPLELSYTYLEDDEAKHLFLLCCLAEEDYDIPIEDLARYGMGLSLFEGINDLANIRNRVFALVYHLKSRHLLLDGKKDECVKVHDVVRDVGISIASKEKGALVSQGVISKWPKKSTYEDYTSISLVISKGIAELPEGLRCPKLELLLLVGRYTASFQLPDNFFEEMGELKVLELRSLGIPLMPSSLGFLRNLQTLCVYSCLVNNISVIGELLNLEILTFRFSDLTELPKEIGRLANLRLLDLTGCTDLKRIPSGVISGLVRLEELYMRESGLTRWEGEGMEEGRNASLREFESLSNLNTLEILIQTEDGAVLQSIPLFSKLTKYTIIIHDSHFECDWRDTKLFQKHLQLGLNKCVPLNCGINWLLRSTESVELVGDGSNDLVRELYREGIEGLQHLKNLLLGYCNTPEYLANSTDWVLQPKTVVFPILESLYLHHLSNLREICHGQLPAGSFGKLSLLEVSSCDKLKNLFRLSIVRCLVQLKRLEINLCNNMEEVIWNERGEDVHDDAINKIEFPKLEIMNLMDLPRLTRFYRGIDKIKLPQLKELTLQFFDNADLLSILTQKVTFPSLEKLRLSYLQNMNEIWCNQLLADSFSKLVKLEVWNCDSLQNLFSPFMARYFVHLRELIIGSCSMVEEVISKEEDEEEKGEGRIDRTPFPKLKYLELCHLPVLRRFCHITHDWELLSVDRIRVANCPQMKIFSPGFVRTPNLDCVKDFRGFENFWTGDLNDTILRLHEEHHQLELERQMREEGREIEAMRLRLVRVQRRQRELGLERMTNAQRTTSTTAAARARAGASTSGRASASGIEGLMHEEQYQQLQLQPEPEWLAGEWYRERELQLERRRELERQQREWQQQELQLQLERRRELERQQRVWQQQKLQLQLERQQRDLELEQALERMTNAPRTTSTTAAARVRAKAKERARARSRARASASGRASTSDWIEGLMHEEQQAQLQEEEEEHEVGKEEGETKEETNDNDDDGGDLDNKNDRKGHN